MCALLLCFYDYMSLRGKEGIKRQDLLIALDNCYSPGFKVQSMQPLTWILSARLLTSADESCPNTAPWSLLRRHCLACQLGSGEVDDSLLSSSRLTCSVINALLSCCYSPSFCAVTHQNKNDKLQNKQIFDS